jgi:hypothetical protein
VHSVVVQLANTEEYQDDASIGSLGEVFIRCVPAAYCGGGLGKLTPAQV